MDVSGVSGVSEEDLRLLCGSKVGVRSQSVV